MVNTIGRISKGSKMDQIYIPKNRTGFVIGEYVLISPLKENTQEKEINKFYFNNIKNLEPIKTRAIERIINLINNKITPSNIIITGSFLEEGFNFNDIDILILSDKEIDVKKIKKEIEELEGIKTHVIVLDNKTLYSGLSSDPLYSLMLSKCVSQNRIIFRVKRRINYKLLDINLLKSKILIDNPEILNGNEKYYLTMNMVSILMFIQEMKLSKDLVNKKIEEIFDIKIKNLQENTLQIQDFLKKYKKTFNDTFNLILNSIKKVEKEK